MLYAEVKIYIENDDELIDADLEDIDIVEAVAELEAQLPELPKGAIWRVEH